MHLQSKNKKTNKQKKEKQHRTALASIFLTQELTSGKPTKGLHLFS